MNILEHLIPKSIRESQAQREEKTQGVVDESRRKRRKADAEIIRAYRDMGQQVAKHEWSK